MPYIANPLEGLPIRNSFITDQANLGAAAASDDTIIIYDISATALKQLTIANMQAGILVAPAFTGVPTAPTASAGTSTTQLATTAFVTAANTALNTVAEMTDVTITSIAADEVLKWNGSAWINQTLLEANILPVAGPTFTGTLTVGSATIVEADLETIDGVTAGTAVASKTIVLDSSTNITGIGTIGSGNITSTGTVQGTTITATTAFVPDASDGAALGTAALEFSDLFLADAAVISLGDDDDVTLTHVVDTGILLSSTDRFQFGDAGTFIHQSADGVLTIESDTTVDINGAVVFDGSLSGVNELAAVSLDISGNADIDGTLEADAITVADVALATYIRDTVGTNMLSSNTESGIAVTYDTSNDNIDFALDTAQTTLVTIYNAALKAGRDTDNLIDFATTDDEIILRVAGANEVKLAANALSPVASDGAALGTASLMWSDLFIADGGVVNFNNGDVTVTHGSNTLTVAGGTLATAALTTSTIVASAIIKTDDATEATTTTDGSLQTDGGLSVVKDAIFGDDVTLISDAAVLNFGLHSDVSLTHVADTALLLNSSRQLQFGDSGTYIHQSADGVLDLVSDTEIEINATTIDINGAVALNGAISGATDITLSGELDAATLDISGIVDIAGVLTMSGDKIDMSGEDIDNIRSATFIAEVNAGWKC